jgi:enoyl-CoA hydratase/carnithine racemase
MAWNPANYPRGRGELRLDRNGSLATLTLDNPGARNAMSVGMMADFLAAVDALTEAPPVALLIHGAGSDGFCAGGDLQDVRGHLMAPGAGREMAVAMGRAMETLAGLDMVIVAAVEGAALGGGAELSQVAHWVIVGESARIGFVHARLGVSPGWGGGRCLISRVGVQAATEILLHARTHSGSDALRLGLADQIVADGSAVAEATAWVDRVLALPEASVRGALRLLSASRSQPDSLRAVEVEVFDQLWGGPAHKAALSTVKAGR